MSSIRTSAAVLLCIAAAALPLPARAQMASCNWYADTALLQQQENEQKKCGFTGPEWNASRQAHLTWCATQVPERWRSEAQKRRQQLAACKR